MEQLLVLKERIQNSIALGESHFREFKSAYEGRPGAKKPRLVTHICRDIGEALVAFANADGGELLIGVEDDGTISGVPHSDDDLQTMLQAVATHADPHHALPLVYHLKINLDGLTVLFFQVEKGSREIYQLPDGRCVVRKERATVPGVISRIQFERQEVRSREYDRQFVDGASVADLDTNLVRTMADGFLTGLSPERYLQQMGLAEYASNGLRLRWAAVLLFARDVQRWYPFSQVRILKVQGTKLGSGADYNVISDEVVRGNIFYLLEESWNQLRPFLAYKTEFGVEAKFEQKYIYPERACREALVNAIAHRDYSAQSGIEVYIFDDRMEIRNPGALLSTITIDSLEKLERVHESRNALIARVLRENKYMRELGEGIERIFKLMEENELEPPKLYSNTTSFRVTLPNRSMFTPQQEQWLSLFEQFPLSRLQKRIVARGMGGVELSQSQIYQAMNTYDREVTGLRTYDILVDIRTNQAAAQLARQKNVKKSDVGRFKVTVPSANPTKVYVGNLPYDADEPTLHKLMTTLGNVLSVKIIRKEGRAFAFVTFASPMEAENAIKQREIAYLDRVLQIRPYRPKDD